MSLFAGILRTEDTNALLTGFEPAIISEGIDQILAKFVADRNAAQGLLVANQVTAAAQRIRDGGVDEGQEIGPDGRPLETHVGGYYDVGYPLKRVGWAIGWNRETFAYMTVADLDREVGAKTAGNARRHTREILKALFGNANYTYPDQLVGDVTVRRLANTDGTLYGADQTEDNHYLVSGYVSGSMSATNNPFVTLATEVREHYGTSSRVIAFINSAQRADVLGKLTNFVDGPTEGVVPANTTATALNPGVAVPGDFLGVEGDSGVYVYVWDRIPSGYIAAGLVDEAAPISRRVPGPAALQGFTQLPEETHLPFYKRQWIELFGYGVSTRLSWTVMQLTTNGSYAVPTI